MAQAKVDVVLKGDDRNLNKALKTSERNITAFASKIKSALVLVAAAFTINAMRKFASESLKLWHIQEEAVVRLTAIIKATGNTTGFTVDQLQQLASQLQVTTRVGDEVGMSMLGILATFKNLRGDEFKRAAALAIDLSAAFKTDLAASAKMVGKALEDPIQGITSLTKANIIFTRGQKEMLKGMVESGGIVKAQQSILSELEGRVGGVASALAKTGSGIREDFSNRIGDMQEVMGKGIDQILLGFVPAIEMIVSTLERLAPTFVTIGKFLGKFVVAFVLGFQTVKNFVTESIAITIATGITAYENWLNVVVIVMKTFQLTVMRAMNIVDHVFSVVIPETLIWLSNNWINIWTDMGNFVSTVIDNMVLNLLNFFAFVQAKLTGEGGEFIWTGLLRGFEATLTELPKIAERVIPETEAQLTAEIKGMTTNVANAFMRNLANVRAAMKVGATTTPLDVNPSFVSPVPRTFDPGDEDTKTDKSLRASFESLDTLNKRITSATALDDLTKKQLDVQKEMLAESKKQTEIFKKGGVPTLQVMDVARFA